MKNKIKIKTVKNKYLLKPKYKQIKSIMCLPKETIKARLYNCSIAFSNVWSIFVIK